MKAPLFNKQTIKVFTLIALVFLFCSSSIASNYNKSNTKRIINKTAYIIDEAYEISNFYDYRNRNYLSKAAYYNNYAYQLYKRRSYRNATYFSIKAREYALYVIDNCNMYWEYYYYTNCGWSHTYGDNPHFNKHNNNSNYGNFDRYSNGYRPQSNNNPYRSNNKSKITKMELNNVNEDNYFDKDEISIINNIPNDKELEDVFQRDNRSINLNNSDVNVERKVFEENKINAKVYRKEVEKSQSPDNRTIRIERPKEINTSIQRRPTSNTQRDIERPNNNTQMDAIRSTNNTQREVTRPNSNVSNPRKENNNLRIEKPNTSEKREVSTNQRDKNVRPSNNNGSGNKTEGKREERTNSQRGNSSESNRSQRTR